MSRRVPAYLSDLSERLPQRSQSRISVPLSIARPILVSFQLRISLGIAGRFSAPDGNPAKFLVFVGNFSPSRERRAAEGVEVSDDRGGWLLMAAAIFHVNPSARPFPGLL